ncbi:ABC transporter substrate-binding protein [Desulforhopalus singaporensis]|uniref:Branched-chain amino acid transport system substrate-binding protein n=1 Tax=Desulforhopalus singaporensis TaxID=91360 RepID=A0A1H0VBW4_9BACT|nr:ABC transporter substrate-binding protein [Desulforhopalus singaporensis]SDP75834.1 branched-chain amino acid transport system substrate-binding protein [Desulforhopalus singaporensis]
MTIALKAETKKYQRFFKTMGFCLGIFAMTLVSTMILPMRSAHAEKQVTVGVLVPLTGELGEFGTVVARSIELGVKQINTAGGTTCGKIRLVTRDTHGNPERGIREATKMIESEGAVAVIGPESGVMVALVDLAKRKKTVIMSPYAGTITLNKLGGDFVYRTVSSDLGDGDASGMWLTEKGYKKVAFLVQNEESTISPAQVAKKIVEKSGMKLTDFVIFNPGQPSYQAELISVLAHNPDAIYLAGGQQSGVTVIKEATSGGFAGEWLFTADLAVPEVFDNVGAEHINGRAYVEFADADRSLPEFKAFEKLYREEEGKEPGPFASNSFDMINLVALAIEASGQCSGSGINSAIRDVADGGSVVTTFAEGKAALAKGMNINFEGASGPLKFDKSGGVSGAYSIQAAKNGKWANEKFYPASVFKN